MNRSIVAILALLFTLLTLSACLGTEEDGETVPTFESAEQSAGDTSGLTEDDQMKESDISAAASGSADVEKKALLEKKSYSYSDGYSVNYWLYTPENPKENMPLIVYLHGGTSKGDNLDLLTEREGFPQYIQQGKLKVSAYIIMPQAPEEVRAWDEMESEVMDVVSYVMDTYQIDKANVSLTGHSMGGIGTWLIGYGNMDIFARIAPISGTVSRRLRDRAYEVSIPVWSFVGTDFSDSNAYSSNTEFFPQLEHHNPNARLTVLQGYQHRDTVKAYLEFDVIGWLIGQSN